MSKSYFGLLDTRNTKYQGLIMDDSFSGIGILIDNIFTTIVSTWEKYSLNGPSIIIFPHLQIFFGQIQQNSPKGLVCFQANQKEKYVINFSKVNSRSEQIKMTIAHTVFMQSITHIQKKSDSQYSVIESFYSKNSDQELKILSNIFKNKVTKENIDLKAYLQKNFIEPYPNFQIVGKKQVFFGFKNSSSLGFKFQNNCLTSIGNFDAFPRNLTFGRKVCYNYALPNKTKIEQGNFLKPIKTFSFLKNNSSPIECQKFNEQYFKKSTTFRNEFTKLDHVDKLYIEFKKIQKMVKQQTVKKIGQTLLENDYGSSHKQEQEQVVVKQYTLSQVRQEIYQAAARKQGTYRSNDRSPIRTSVKRHTESEYIEPILDSGRFYGQSRRTDHFNPNMLSAEREQRNRIFNEQFLRQPLVHGKSFRKLNLIENVNLRINTEKQTERALLNELLREKNLKEVLLVSQREKFIQTSPLSNQFSARRKYQRYQNIKQFYPSGSPQRRSIQGKSLKRNYNYTETQRSRQRSPKPQRSPYDRRNTNLQMQAFNRLNNTSPTVNPFSHEFSNENTSKTHDHLAKYKERKRGVPFKQNGQQNIINHENRYKYMEQNEEERIQLRQTLIGSHKLTRELKLFGADKYSKKSYNQIKQNNPNSVRKQQNDQKNSQKRNHEVNKEGSKQLIDRTNNMQSIGVGHKQNSNEQPRPYFKRVQNGKKNISIGIQNGHRQLRDVTPTRAKRTFRYVD